MRFFVHQFVSQRETSTDDKDLDDAAFITKTTLEFMSFVKDLPNSKDVWISTCGNFLKMSFDFLEFVNAYRIGDAITIKYGYQKHLPVFLALGKNTYVGITYSQQEKCYRDNPYSMLQDLRINRFVWQYHPGTGKRCVAQDEFLEHGNKFYAEFPMPCSLEAFAL